MAIRILPFLTSSPVEKTHQIINLKSETVAYANVLYSVYVILVKSYLNIRPFFDGLIKSSNFIGSEVEIALFCDIRIAADDVKFRFPEVGLGIIPAAGGTQTLPRAIGSSRALEILLTDRVIEAKEALQIQIVNDVVSNDSLLRRVETIARKIASRDQKAIQSVKQAVSRGLERPLAEGLELEKTIRRPNGNSL